MQKHLSSLDLLLSCNLFFYISNVLQKGLSRSTKISVVEKEERRYFNIIARVALWI